MNGFAVPASISVHTGQHGLDTPMTRPASYSMKYKNDRISVEMIQLPIVHLLCACIPWEV